METIIIRLPRWGMELHICLQHGFSHLLMCLGTSIISTTSSKSM